MVVNAHDEGGDMFRLSRQYLIAGGVFSVESDRTGKSLTFQVKRPKSVGEKEPGGARFVTVKDGAKFALIGILDATDGSFRPTGSSAAGYETQARAFQWVASAVWSGKTPGRCKVTHDGVCCRCGRRLLDPESVELGIGPTCRTLVGW